MKRWRGSSSRTCPPRPELSITRAFPPSKLDCDVSTRLLATIARSGCGVVKTPLDLGGSKGDGTVIIGANVGEFDRVSWDGAQAKATKRCMAWGYSGTEAFEGIRERCITPGGWSRCAEKEVSRAYQCLD